MPGTIKSSYDLAVLPNRIWRMVDCCLLDSEPGSCWSGCRLGHILPLHKSTVGPQYRIVVLSCDTRKDLDPPHSPSLHPSSASATCEPA
ncbi:hypothetical protein EV715DRAFT_298381 [Schizophyllum commune]